MSSSIQIPNSPNELIIQNEIQNHNFSLDEIEKIIRKLSYQDRDNLLYHLIQDQIKFHLFLLKKSDSDDELNKDQIISDLTKLQIIKDLYYSI